MTYQLSQTLAERIAARMRRDGYDQCTSADVLEVWNTGTHENAALASAIQQELAELGMTP